MGKKKAKLWRIDMASILNDPFKQKIRNYYININDCKRLNEYQPSYDKLFKSPIKNVFYWSEEDRNGNILSIYKYLDKFIYIHGFIGYESYSKHTLNRIFADMEIYENVNDIDIGMFSHPDLISKFNEWKFNQIKNDA